MKCELYHTIIIVIQSRGKIEKSHNRYPKEIYMIAN